MDKKIDANDLSEEEVSLVRDFISLLISRHRANQQLREPEKNWADVAGLGFSNDWDNEKDAAYDEWRQRYHVQTR